MKDAYLTRGTSSLQGTFGLLTYGGISCFTTELPWRDNIPQKSCIPVGTYSCAIVNSPKFGRVYSVLNVPGRSSVLIHSANLGGNVDEGFDTQLHGCIAPAMKMGVMLNSHGVMQRAGLVSRPALRSFMLWANGEPFKLEIV